MYEVNNEGELSQNNISHESEEIDGSRIEYGTGSEQTNQPVNATRQSARERKESCLSISQLATYQKIAETLEQNDLPDIIVFKNRTESKGTYLYLSKYTGIIKRTDFSGILSKLVEQLHKLSFYAEAPIPLFVKHKYNIVEETIKSVDEIIFNPTLPFGIVENKADAAFTVFNFCKQSPVKKSLLAEIQHIKHLQAQPLNRKEEFSAENTIAANLNENLSLSPEEHQSAYQYHLANSVDELYDKLQSKYSHTSVLIRNIIGAESLSPEDVAKRTKYFLNWLARASRPEDGKCGTALVFRGAQGTGKTAFFELFMSYLFSHYIVFDNQKLESSFNDGIERAEFVLCEEVEISDQGAAKAYAKLKEYITNRTTDMNVKCLSARNVRIWFNMVFLQNPGKVMRFEVDDRRYTCFVTSSTKLKDVVKEKFGYTDIDAQYFEYIKQYERDLFLRDLLNIRYNKAKTESILVTPEKIELSNQTVSIEQVIARYIRQGEFVSLYQDGYIHGADLRGHEEKVINFYIEASNGFMSQDSKLVFAYFAKLHGKIATNHRSSFEDITTKEASDICQKAFPKADNKRLQFNGKRQRIFVLDNLHFNKRRFDVACAFLSNKDEKLKEFLRLVNIEYSATEELCEIKHELLGCPSYR